MKLGKIKDKINKVRITILSTPFMLMLLKAKVFATTTTIGTQEVQTATQNIKDAVVKLAIPIGSVLRNRGARKCAKL